MDRFVVKNGNNTRGLILAKRVDNPNNPTFFTKYLYLSEIVPPRKN